MSFATNFQRKDDVTAVTNARRRMSVLPRRFPIRQPDGSVRLVVLSRYWCSCQASQGVVAFNSMLNELESLHLSLASRCAYLTTYEIHCSADSQMHIMWASDAEVPHAMLDRLTFEPRSATPLFLAREVYGRRSADTASR